MPPLLPLKTMRLPSGDQLGLFDDFERQVEPP